MRVRLIYLNGARPSRAPAANRNLHIARTDTVSVTTATALIATRLVLISLICRARRLTALVILAVRARFDRLLTRLEVARERTGNSGGDDCGAVRPHTHTNQEGGGREKNQDGQYSGCCLKYRHRFETQFLCAVSEKMRYDF